VECKEIYGKLQITSYYRNNDALLYWIYVAVFFSTTILILFSSLLNHEGLKYSILRTSSYEDFGCHSNFTKFVVTQYMGIRGFV